LALSEKERDRLRVLHEVEQGQLKQGVGAELLGMTGRGFRKLLYRYREKGDAALVHGLTGTASNRRLAEADTVRAMEVVRSRYADFGPTLAAECLKREFGIQISRETLRQLMIRAEVWKAKPRRIGEIHTWRPRRSCRGELVQWDTSVHAWLEERGPEKMYLIALIDDATSTLFARFVPADSTEQHMRVLWGYIERYGRPLAVYTDKAGLFQPTLAPGWKTEEPGEKTETQLGRAFRELGMEWIAAHSPQAKGRVERSFQTMQDRLVKGLRLADARSIEDGNRHLEKQFLPEWNERFTVKPNDEFNAHRPVGETLRLESILSHVEPRQVDNNYTVAWQGGHWQIPKTAVRPGLRRSSVRVEMRLNGTLCARVGDDFVELKACEKPQPRRTTKPPRPARRYVPPPGTSQWMNGFSVQGNAAWKALREREQAACGSKESDPPFPFPPRGKPGRAGSPHAAKSAAPPQEGCRPLVNPPRTVCPAGIRNFLLCRN
jgi:transposase